MSLFSEVLKEYVKKSRISVSKLSLETEIDRTLFHKYMSGSRLPKNRQEVKRIGRTLMLPSKQQCVLLECYDKSIYGEKNYESFGRIKHILEGMQDLRIAGDQKIMDVDIVHKLSLGDGKEGVAFYGKLQVEDALIQLLWLVAGRDKKECIKVRMMIQPNQDNIIKPILRVCSRLNIELEHIICLDYDRNDNDNIGLLFSVLAFEFSNVKYQSYFYYDDIDHHVNQMSLIPNMILVGDFLFLCGSEADGCLVTRQKIEVDFFNREYERIKSHTERLGVAIKDDHKLAEMVGVLTESGPIDLQMGYSPYLLMGINEKMLKSHLMMDMEAKDFIFQYTRQNGKKVVDDRVFQDYFSEFGLRRFLETGKIPGYPTQLLLPFSPQERISILMRMIQYLKAGYVSFYMEKGEKICMDDAIMICTGREGSVNFWCKGGGYGKTIRVQETSIRDSLYRFVDFAKENGWFYSREETIQRMELLLGEFSSKSFVTKWVTG